MHADDNDVSKIVFSSEAGNFMCLITFQNVIILTLQK